MPFHHPPTYQGIQFYLQVMKFSKSQRASEPHLYTPPPNYYDPLISNSKNILTGSLAGPSPFKEQACFGLEKRFKANSSHAPGPGAYHSHKQETLNTGLVEQRSKVRQKRQQAFMGSETNSPSIPYHPFSQDEEELQYAKQLLMNEDLNRSSLSLRKKAQGFTFSKSPRVCQPKGESERKAEDVPLESINQYAIQKQARRGKLQMVEQVKKSSEKRHQIMNTVNPQFVPSLQLIELITRRRTKYNPGPGAYSQPTKETQAGVSFTTSKRFSEDTGLSLGPGQYKILQEKKSSISFSKSARTLFDLKSEIDLQHRFYIDPLKNIKQNEAVKQKITPFGSQASRFSKAQREQPLAQEDIKAKRASRLQEVVEKRLKKLQVNKKHTCESDGLLGISTMASTID